MSAERDAFLDWVLARDGTPYCWPAPVNGYLGKGRENPREPLALDCSGTVTCGLFVATNGRIRWQETHSAARLFAELEPTTSPQPGDLCFYGRPGRISHVMVWVGDGRVIGASGGNSDTLSREIAQRQGARVKFKSSHTYRPDFSGFRRLPVA